MDSAGTSEPGHDVVVGRCLWSLPFVCPRSRKLGSRLGLEHLRERLGRIGKLGGLDRDAALDQPADHGDVALRVDADRIGDDAPSSSNSSVALSPIVRRTRSLGCATGQPTPWMYRSNCSDQNDGAAL